ncbi:hypothetical protein ERJ75_001831100 [Trypanosoma vivax]|nr:hypothetical protein ERJ75_001831100 [Trypanosoma vivax]
MKTLLEADDALHAAENALAAANRTLDDATRLSENAHDKHEALAAALNRENGTQHAALARHQSARELVQTQAKAAQSKTHGVRQERSQRVQQTPRGNKVRRTASTSGG